ncbi:HAD hydrolase [Dentipellis sp. KUC8613]|nr:HAD hydrolase [Dentipellis sp. KUC8613]
MLRFPQGHALRATRRFASPQKVEAFAVLRGVSLTRSYRKPAKPPLSFVFDIDGVLLRESTVLPAAKRALTLLEGDNAFGTKIPYILVTNGGGKTEEDRCKDLTSELGFPITTSQFIQSHTILKSHSHRYADEPVLVLGGRRDEVKKIAEGYGFKKAYSTLDVKAWNPHVWPFYDLTPEELASTTPIDFSKTRLSAIFVFHDPRNWALDVQVATDVILSGGVIGAPYVHPKKRSSAEKPVQLVFCNPDLQWGAQFERPRLGQGAFRVAFQAVFKSLTGMEYPYEQYGKPTNATYQFAENVLREHTAKVIGGPVDGTPSVYMIGDNPESDIAGANAAGWSSILVHTGVYNPEDGPPTHQPTHEAEDVEAAVKWAIEREFTK